MYMFFIHYQGGFAPRSLHSHPLILHDVLWL